MANSQEVKEKQVAAKKFPWATNGGYDFYEVLSALQKSVRRSLEEETLYWAMELYQSEYAGPAWSRMLIMASEDVGLADSNVVVKVKVLYDLWAKDKKAGEGQLHFVHAVMILVRAPKSRIVDHATIVARETLKSEHRPIPDYALDKHTIRGRNMGRWYKFFRKTSAKLVQPHDDVAPMVDPYEERSFELLEKHDPIPKHCNGGVETE